MKHLEAVRCLSWQQSLIWNVFDNGYLNVQMILKFKGCSWLVQLAGKNTHFTFLRNVVFFEQAACWSMKSSFFFLTFGAHFPLQLRTIIFKYHGINPKPVKLSMPKQVVICKAFSLMIVPSLRIPWMCLLEPHNGNRFQFFQQWAFQWCPLLEERWQGTWLLSNALCFFYKCVYCEQWKPKCDARSTCVPICA